ncbi:MAG TPA: hypothetical protein VG672_13030 [Bryobacteraceae bacterium]|nr:hypothetical protein [Bryobacteraceae bacterium]
MLSSHRGSEDANLDALFQAYRDACRAPEPSANFMPALWERIEARQRYSFFFGRLATRIVTAAMAVCLAMGVYLVVPHRSSVFNGDGYIEALSGGHTVDLELAHTDTYPVDEL